MSLTVNSLFSLQESPDADCLSPMHLQRAPRPATRATNKPGAVGSIVSDGGYGCFAQHEASLSGSPLSRGRYVQIVGLGVAAGLHRASRSRCSLRARKPCCTHTVANSVYEIIGSIDLASNH